MPARNLTRSNPLMNPISQPRADRTNKRKPRASNRDVRKWLTLALLALGAFGVTFVVVNWGRGRQSSPQGGPDGMVWVPGGEFTMGTNSDLSWPDEKPPHRVRVGGFWMDATDVTNAQFRAFVDTT